jgi:hypothetical protein
MNIYLIKTDGITDGISPFEIKCKTQPLLATLVEFKRLLKARGLELPVDLVCKNGKDTIVFEYSYNDHDDVFEKVQLVFKVQRL